ncbi:MAG: aminotransferase class V-fold PLP-dependent enzyme [Bacteroidota bacterium]
MRDKILSLENTARHLEPNLEERSNLMKQLQDYADHFVENIEISNAYFEAEGKHIAKYPIGSDTHKLEDILNLFRENVEESGINPASGKHFGYVPGGGIVHSAYGDFLAAITNRYAGIYFANPGAVRIENQLIRWMCDLIGYDDKGFGNLTSGGSIANLVAVTAARDSKGIRAKMVEKAVVYVTTQLHHCVLKALRIAGMAEVIIRHIPMDEFFRMRTDLLEEQIEQDNKAGLKPFLAVASAGSTDVGVVDPMNEIANICEKNDLWFHVDGAYGGAFLLADVENENGSTVKDLFKGIKRADSVTLDPHKGFFIPYGLGAILVKDKHALYQSHHYTANYLQDAEGLQEPSPSDLSPELTKHFRGLRFWLPLQLIGIEPFKAALEEKIWLTRYFYEKVQALGFEVGPYPDLSIMIYRHVPQNKDANDWNQSLVQQIWQDGRFFVSSTKIDDVYWIRMAVLSFRTHLKEIDDFLDFLQILLAKSAPNLIAEQ